MVAQAMKQSAVAAKRRQALKLIAEFSFGSTSVSSLPTPLLEVPKQVVLTATDLTLCWRLYALYYDETLSLDSLLALLKRAGVITVVGGVSVYAGARSLQGMVDEALNLTIVGTIFSGFIAGSYTAGFGLAFLYWVDRCWQQDQPALLGGSGQ
jgi:uncharacterized protein (DUF697 family)